MKDLLLLTYCCLILDSQDNINQGDSDDEAAAQHTSRTNSLDISFPLTQYFIQLYFDVQKDY